MQALIASMVNRGSWKGYFQDANDDSHKDSCDDMKSTPESPNLEPVEDRNKGRFCWSRREHEETLE